MQTLDAVRGGSMQQAEHIAVLCSDAKAVEDLRRAIDLGDPSQRTVSLVHGSLDALGPLLTQHQFDVLVVHGACESVDELQQLHDLLERYPQMAVVVASRNVASDFLLSALRLGIRDVLPLPVEAAALQAAVARLTQVAARTAPDHDHHKVLAFLSCKGGSGATVLATNLGFALGEEGAKTLLIDLNRQFGDAALSVSDRIPTSTLADVTGPNIHRLDASFLASAVLEVAPQFAVLAAPEELERATAVRAEDVETLIRLAASHYRFVVLDLGRTLDAVTVRALDQADIIYLVLQQGLPYVRDAKRTLEALQALGYPRERIRLLINRYQRGAEISSDDIALSVGMPVHATIPNSYATVAAAVNQGLPIGRAAHRDPVAKALHHMADGLIDRPLAKKAGWFRSLWA